MSVRIASWHSTSLNTPGVIYLKILQAARPWPISKAHVFCASNIYGRPSYVSALHSFSNSGSLRQAVSQHGFVAGLSRKQSCSLKKDETKFPVDLFDQFL
ncbi:hypothetical protein V6N11_008055 [Hibiscus sabdariffa]|uniref:Uncharacterized protein n=1 Tax=Hibiscus sabdariffa TaxID=183260 RepID=A0ABR2Q050_9ROSI